MRFGLQVTYANLAPSPPEQLLEFGVNSEDAFDRLVLRKGDTFSLTASNTDPAYLVNHSIGATFALDAVLPTPR